MAINLQSLRDRRDRLRRQHKSTAVIDRKLVQEMTKQLKRENRADRKAK